jgi:hypothetical protein
MPLLYTGGINQIIPTKRIEDGKTSIFASRQGLCTMLTIPSSFSVNCRYCNETGEEGLKCRREKGELTT